MFLVCKMVHGSLRRAVHGICIVLSWSSPAGAKLSMLVFLYMQALCHLPCGLRLPYDVHPPISKELVFSPHGEEMRSHPGVAAQRALPLGRPTVSVTHDTRCSRDAGWACYEARTAWWCRRGPCRQGCCCATTPSSVAHSWMSRALGYGRASSPERCILSLCCAPATDGNRKKERGIVSQQ